MKVTLTIDGQPREFYSRGITAGASLTAFDLLEEIGEKTQEGTLYSKEHREGLLRFVVKLFGGQFTEQQFLKNCEDSFFSVVPGTLRAAVTGVQAKAAFPNVQAEAEAKACPLPRAFAGCIRPADAAGHTDGRDRPHGCAALLQCAGAGGWAR